MMGCTVSITRSLLLLAFLFAFALTIASHVSARDLAATQHSEPNDEGKELDGHGHGHEHEHGHGHGGHGGHGHYLPNTENKDVKVTNIKPQGYGHGGGYGYGHGGGYGYGHGGGGYGHGGYGHGGHGHGGGGHYPPKQENGN